MTWAEPCDGQVRRVFEIDITICPDGDGRLRWIAGDRLRGAACGGPPTDVTEPAVIRKILLHVQSRAPPCGGLPDTTLPGTHAQFTLAG